jgi:hypothetical protein
MGATTRFRRGDLSEDRRSKEDQWESWVPQPGQSEGDRTIEVYRKIKFPSLCLWNRL